MTSKSQPRNSLCSAQTLVVLVLLGAFGSNPRIVSAENQTKTVLKTEHFDRDPDWDGVNNRVKVEQPNPVIQDFGYSSGNHAGGKAAGEIGGRIQRSTTSAFYGMRLEKPKTLDSRLRCSGSFAATQSAGMSGLYFGWFNTKTPGSRPYNWMGMSLNGAGKGCEVGVGYRTAGGLADGPGRVTGYGPGWYQKPKVRDIHVIPNDGTRGVAPVASTGVATRQENESPKNIADNEASSGFAAPVAEDGNRGHPASRRRSPSRRTNRDGVRRP